MSKRYIAIWFRHLKTDWMIRQHPDLKDVPFVLTLPDHGRIRITEVSAVARSKGIERGMVLADARIILPEIKDLEDDVQLAERLLKNIGLWCIRFTPVAAIDLPDGLILDVSGCAHLWGGEAPYLRDILNKLKGFGYHIRAAMADTIGAAWAVSRFGKTKAIIKPGEQEEAITALPPAALRPEPEILERLYKLGLDTIGSFSAINRSAVRRRFGQQLLLRLDQALGYEEETLQPVIAVEPYQERLPSLEPIQTRKGIEIALQQLLNKLCERLRKEGKGIRSVSFTGFRIDGKMEEIAISTNHSSINTTHLLKLFELKIAEIEPALGIELFMLTATKVEELKAVQYDLWGSGNSLKSTELAQLLDRIEGKLGRNLIHRYLPAQHHMPERSVKPADSLSQKPEIPWRTDKLRPVHLLQKPEPVVVTAPVPDYPPMNFKYGGKLYKVKKADGPERIEPEWWLEKGLTRDYYVVEDEEGKRYWLFRSGHYDGKNNPHWFIHGFFA